MLLPSSPQPLPTFIHQSSNIYTSICSTWNILPPPRLGRRRSPRSTWPRRPDKEEFAGRPRCAREPLLLECGGTPPLSDGETRLPGGACGPGGPSDSGGASVPASRSFLGRHKPSGVAGLAPASGVRALQRRFSLPSPINPLFQQGGAAAPPKTFPNRFNGFSAPLKSPIPLPTIPSVPKGHRTLASHEVAGKTGSNYHSVPQGTLERSP